MRWPDGLKDRVRSVVGERGITQFAVTAVESALLAESEAARRDVAYAHKGEVVGEAEVVEPKDFSTGPVNEPEESGPISGPEAPSGVSVASLEAVKAFGVQYGLVTARDILSDTKSPTRLCPDCSTPLLAGAECAACSF